MVCCWVGGLGAIAAAELWEIWLNIIVRSNLTRTLFRPPLPQPLTASAPKEGFLVSLLPTVLLMIVFIL
jgi:hypothetical protein